MLKLDTVWKKKKNDIDHNDNVPFIMHSSTPWALLLSNSGGGGGGGGNFSKGDHGCILTVKIAKRIVMDSTDADHGEGDQRWQWWWGRWQWLYSDNETWVEFTLEK